MNTLEVIGLVLAALFGAGGPLALYVSNRTVRGAKDTGEDITKRLAGIETTLNSINYVGENTTKRLNNHDKEIEEHEERILIHDNKLAEHNERIVFLEKKYQQ